MLREGLSAADKSKWPRFSTFWWLSLIVREMPRGWRKESYYTHYPANIISLRRAFVLCWVAVHSWLNSHRFLQCGSSTLCAKVKNLQLRRKSGSPIWESLREKLIFLPRQKVNLIHFQLWEQGYIKGVPFFLRKRGVVSHTTFLRVFGRLSMFSAALQRQDDFRMKHIYVKCYENL